MEDLNKSVKILSEWLEEMDSKVNEKDFVHLNDLTEKKSNLEKLKALVLEIGCHAELVENLQSRLKEDSTLPAGEYEPLFTKYSNIQDFVNNLVATIEGQVKEHEDYHQAYSEACDWIRKTHIAVQAYADSHGEKKDVEEKLKKVAAIEAKFDEGQDLVFKANKNLVSVIQIASPDGQDNLKQEFSQLEQDWDALKTSTSDTKNLLSRCADAWTDYNDLYDKIKCWIDEFDKKVKKELETGGGKTPDDLERCQSLLEEAVSNQVGIEALADRCETLVDLSACGRVRDETLKLQTTYTGLLTTIQG